MNNNTTMGSLRVILSLMLVASWWLDVPSCHGFIMVSRNNNNINPLTTTTTSQRSPTSHRRPNSNPFFLVDEDSSDDLMIIMGNSELDLYQDATSDKSFFRALQERQEALKNGIGKRYIARTQKGFLNIHYEPTDPYHTDNIVGQLQEGQIVTSTGHMRGFWIPHDGGGWSISKFGGFTWLEPIDE